MRYFFIKTKEQNSMKKRFIDYKSYSKLQFGNNGFFIKKSVRFEFSYFLILKKFLKIFLKSKYSLKSLFSFWFFLFGNFPVTKKSKNARMGKGKGVFLRWSIRLPLNYVFLEFKYLDIFFLKLLFYKLKNNFIKSVYLIHFNVDFEIK